MSEPELGAKRREPTFLRPRDGRLLGGVCAAVSRRIALDVVIVRAAWSVPILLHAPFAGGWPALGREPGAPPDLCRWLWIATAIPAGAAVAAYLLCWLLIPEE